MKRTVGGIDEAVEVDGVLRAKQSRSTTCSGARGGSVLQAKQSRSTACSGVGGGGVLRVKRSRLTAK
jgi:hypothetical protein